MTVPSIGEWRTNAELIAYGVKPLGYLDDRYTTLDPTYGKGRFWNIWKPAKLVGCDINLAMSPIGESIDFTMMPWPENSFERVVFDPPYKLNGTSSGKGPAASDRSYGVATSVPWQYRHALIKDGMKECVRVLAPKGMLLLKCQDQVCSGQVRWQTFEFSEWGQHLGLALVDMFHLVGSRPQPPNRRQVHARRNYSSLLVFSK
jgi:hypothetical protein